MISFFWFLFPLLAGGAGREWFHAWTCRLSLFLVCHNRENELNVTTGYTHPWLDEHALDFEVWTLARD